MKTRNKLVTVFFSFLQFRSEENFNSSCMSSNQDLLTIDMETIATLRSDEIEASLPATPENPSAAITIDTKKDRDEIPVAEDVIQTCVTPRKVRGVQSALQKETKRHRCAVKLLPYFFTDEELVSSNTDGTHGKLALDSNRLNSLKVLVFSKFAVECAAEKEKLWKYIKAKINDRCRALKFAKRAN